MPIGKLANTAGKGADYSAGSQNIQHAGKGNIVFMKDLYRRCDNDVFSP